MYQCMYLAWACIAQLWAMGVDAHPSLASASDMDVDVDVGAAV
jgi:hypothetical protein